MQRIPNILIGIKWKHVNVTLLSGIKNLVNGNFCNGFWYLRLFYTRNGIFNFYQFCFSKFFIILEQFKAFCKRTKLVVPREVVTSAWCSDWAAPKISSWPEQHSLIIGDTLDPVGPSSRQKACSLIGLAPSIHRHELIIAKQAGHVLSKGSNRLCVEISRSLCQFRGLGNHSFKNLGVDVTLVAGTVASQTVHVAMALAIPNVDTLAPLERHGQRSVILDEGVLIKVHVILVCAWLHAKVAANSRLKFILRLLQHDLVLVDQQMRKY